MMTPDDVKRLRLERGMTQAELAAALGVTVTTVARWEQGARTVGPLATLALMHLEPPRGDGPRKARALRCPSCRKAVPVPPARGQFMVCSCNAWLRSVDGRLDVLTAAHWDGLIKNARGERRRQYTVLKQRWAATCRTARGA